MAENQHFFEKISEEKYVKSREGYVDMVLPKDPEAFLVKVVREQYVDEQLMPKVLAMAKNHVDAINSINRMAADGSVMIEETARVTQQNSDSAQKIETLNKIISDLKALNNELQQKLGFNNEKISNLNNQISQHNKDYHQLLDSHKQQTQENMKLNQMLDTLTSRVKSIEQEQRTINYEKVQSSSHLNSIQITKYQQAKNDSDHEENKRNSTVQDADQNPMRRARHRVDSESGQSISASRGRLPSNDRIDIAQTTQSGKEMAGQIVGTKMKLKSNFSLANLDKDGS